MFSRVSRFFWGPNHDPTLVPSHVGFNVECDSSKCIVADRVDHCVPVFREEVSFTHGVPAMRPASDAAHEVHVVEDSGYDEVKIIDPKSGAAPHSGAEIVVQTPPEFIGDMVPETPVDQIPEFQRLSANVEISDSPKDPAGPGENMTWSPRNPRFRPRMAMFLLITCFVINRHPNIAMLVDL